MRNLIFSCLLMVIVPFSKACAKGNLNDSTDFIYNRVYKNIAAYNIKYANFRFNGAIDNSPFYSTTDFFYEAFLPDYSSQLLMNITQIDEKYPTAGYKIFQVELNGIRFKKGRALEVRTGISPGQFFLIAVDSIRQRIKFISGQFFLSAISEDFGVNLNDPKSLIQYLKLRLHSIKVRDIKYIKRSRRKLYYTGYSNVSNHAISIIVDEKNVEHPVIILK